jgi:hypothetical protein
MQNFDVRPKIILRAVGGWLAVSPPGARFKIGVMAETEEEAGRLFHAAWRRWDEIIEMGKEKELA